MPRVASEMNVIEVQSKPRQRAQERGRAETPFDTLVGKADPDRIAERTKPAERQPGKPTQRAEPTAAQRDKPDPATASKETAAPGFSGPEQAEGNPASLAALTVPAIPPVPPAPPALPIDDPASIPPAPTPEATALPPSTNPTALPAALADPIPQIPAAAGPAVVPGNTAADGPPNRDVPPAPVGPRATPATPAIPVTPAVPATPADGPESNRPTAPPTDAGQPVREVAARPAQPAKPAVPATPSSAVIDADQRPVPTAQTAKLAVPIDKDSPTPQAKAVMPPDPDASEPADVTKPVTSPMPAAPPAPKASVDAPVQTNRQPQSETGLPEAAAVTKTHADAALPMAHATPAPERASALSAHPIQPPAPNDPPSQPVPIAGLAIEIAARAQAGKKRFEIRLDPPELGRIDVRLDIDRHGQVSSRLVVERSETLDLLRRDAADLERALQQAGLKTADQGLQFALRDQAFGQRGQNDDAPPVARVVVPDAGHDVLSAAYAAPAHAGGLDIRV